MNPKSPLQQQFPLSSKKFWKKMISALLGLYIMGGFVAVMMLAIFVIANTSDGSGSIIFGIIGLDIVFLAFVSFIYGFYINIYIREYFYAGEENFITIKKGVFAPAEIHVQWQKIQDVYVDQDILDRIMGLYDVHIASATVSSGIEAHIDGVDQTSAEGLKKFFLDKVSGRGQAPAQNNGSIPMPMNANQMASVSTAPVAPRMATVNLPEEISSKTYPLSASWMTMSIIGRVISSVFISAFLTAFAGGYFITLFLGGNILNGIFAWFMAFIAIVVIQLITLSLWKKNYAFDFTPDNIYYRQGILSISEKHMPYSSIQDVTIKQSLIERMFGLASVMIENAAQQQVYVGRNGRPVSVFSGVMIRGLSLADANKITVILKTTVLGRSSGQYGL